MTRNWISPKTLHDASVVATLGEVLHSASRADYFIDGRPNPEDAGPLELRFESGRILVMDLVPDGESVTASATPLVFLEPTPGYYVWQRVALTSKPSWRPLIGQPVLRAEALLRHLPSEPPATASIVAWRLRFPQNVKLCYYNHGDDAQILINTDPWHNDCFVEKWVEITDRSI